MEINDKYIATLMQRHYVGENTFVYNASHIILGTVDEKTKNFIDHNGNEYYNMLKNDSMTTEVPYSYYNILPIDELYKVIKDKTKPIDEQFSEYEYLAKGIIYLVIKTDRENSCCFPLKIDELCSNIQKAAEAIKNKETSLANQTAIDSQEEIYDEDLEEIVTDEMSEDLTELVVKVIRGEYNIDELKNIKNQLSNEYYNIESALETIDLQVEANETGKTLVEISQEKEQKETEEIVIENDIDITDVYQKVTSTLIAQDEAARHVISEIARKLMNPSKRKQAILLTGSTGVGKTKLMELIARHINKPFIKVNSTDLTIPGYVGRNIEEILWDLYVKCGKDKEKTENAIIFFDEIDKKGSSKKTDISGQGVLNVLLPFIEGGTYKATSDLKTSKEEVEINTKNMIVIFGGAFSDVYKRLYDSSLGFNRDVIKRKREATNADFVNFGLMTDEFMGRVAVIKLNDLEINDLKRVMLESNESALKVQKRIFEELGVKITFTNDYITTIATNAYNEKTGARGLNNVVDDTTWMAFEEIYKKENRGKYSEVILDEETVNDASKYQLVKRVNESKEGISCEN